MSVPAELIEQVEKLTPEERRELFARFGVNGTPPHVPRINRTPNVCGGSACLNNTRIAVWLLEEMRRNGASDAHLLDLYPQFGPADLAAAWEYVAAHRDEIDEEIRRNEEAMDGPPVE
ncbi:MAG: DUF433 domain-containing protein [Gemmataceae bacterium]|nr:DUF433 domain-containing protein [Gemmataceae bacterium]